MAFVFRGENEMIRFSRYYRIQIICAEVPALLTVLSSDSVELQEIEWIDPLTVNITIRRNHLKNVKRFLERNDVSWKIIKKEGKMWKTSAIGNHPILLIGFIAFLAAIMIAPKCVFFMEVTGNQRISTQEVLMNAEKAGIKFGTLTSSIRSESVKNKLLQSMPQLQWVGVTTRGCVAVIQIKERSIHQTGDSASGVVSSIVAACDGVITEQTVYEGNPLFEIGDTVKKGDTLVSGYVDCGIKLRAGQSDAEIYAYTTREQQFLSPQPTFSRNQFQGKHTCYKLRVGKKVINFCNHSGIMDTCCVKMYSEDCLSLPSGFQLPVSLITITHLYYETMLPLSDNSVSAWLPQYAREYLSDQMVSGKIVKEVLQQVDLDDVSILTGTYACHEMIGRQKHEGINK